MEANLNVYNQVAHEYTDYKLTPSEIKILERFKEKWHTTNMLDIGVGTGRTSYTFSVLVDQYHGIDYSTSMINRCKQIINEHNSCRLDVQDATDLSALYGNDYDFIMFSLNGIDSVEHDKRIQILSEVAKVLNKDGYFFFSTHSLYSFPFEVRLPTINLKNLAFSSYYWLKAFKQYLRLKWHYRGVDEKSVLEKNNETLITGDHDFKMGIYHIKPDQQVKQLQEAGYEVVTAYNQSGDIIDPMTDQSNSYIYYLCKLR